MSNVKYNVYNHEDKKVATISENKNSFELELFVEDIHELPIFLQEISSSEEIERFLSKRVLPAGRHGIEEVLLTEGIENYNWKDLIILNSGRVLTDNFYVLTEINGVESEKSTCSGIQVAECWEYAGEDEEELW